MPSAAYNEMVAFIRQEAIKRGINPDVAVRVAQTEALNVFDPSKPDLGGDDRSSFGLYQLHYGGLSKKMPNPGLGDEFTKKTGLDARDPSTWKQQVTFSLDHAAKNGWSAWMGAKNNGIGDFDGIPGRSPNAGAVAPGVPTPATSTGSAPAGTTLIAPTTNVVAPYELGETLPPAGSLVEKTVPMPDIDFSNPWSSLAKGLSSSLGSGGSEEGGMRGTDSAETAMPGFADAAPRGEPKDMVYTEGQLGELFKIPGIGQAVALNRDKRDQPIRRRGYG